MSEITVVSTSPGGTTQSAATTWTVRAPVGQAPLRIFERRLYLRLPIAGAAGVLVDAQATMLSGQFQAISYAANAASAPGGPATLSNLNGDSTVLVVALDAPRRVTRVTLAAGTAGNVAHTLELYRLDEQRRADDPTVSRDVAANTEAADLQPDDFTDLRFALRLKRSDSAAYTGLPPGALATLQVQTRPTSPRIGLATPGSQEAPLIFWQAPGELAPGAPEGHVSAAAAFAGALQRQLDRALEAARDQVGAGTLAQLPTHVDMALVIQSDAPCDLLISTLKVAYRLLQDSFAGAEPKQVLRFAGQGAEQRQVELHVPAGATIHAASLRAVESFRAERPAPTATTLPDPDPTPEQRQGVLLGAGLWAAQSFTPVQALSLQGCALAVMALAVPAELTLEVQEDWRGRPSGRRLAAARVTIERAGRPVWVRIPFAAPVVLPSQPHWLMIQAVSGRLLCLLDAGDPSARLLEQGKHAADWREGKVFDNLVLLYQLLSSIDQAAASEANGGTPAAPYTLRIGAQVVPDVAGPDSSRSFDLTTALQHELLDQVGAGAPALQLTFTAFTPGLLTVYPPHIEYSL